MDAPYQIEIRQNIDPYPLATEVKLLWDKQERVGVIVPIDEEDGTPPGTVVMRNVVKGDESYTTHVVVTSYGDTMQAVYWQGEGVGFWSPEYLLPKEFDIMKRPAVTISRHSMYVIEYGQSGLVIKEGFMFIKSDDPQEDWE